MGLQRQRLHIDVGIFPDLIVDEALEHEGEEAFERAPFRGGGLCMSCAFEECIGHGDAADRWFPGEEPSIYAVFMAGYAAEAKPPELAKRPTGSTIGDA